MTVRFLYFVISALLILMSCDEGADKISTTIQIVAPEDSDTVHLPDIAVEVELIGPGLSQPEVFLHYQLNEEEPVSITKTSFVISGLSAGRNVIYVELSKGDHMIAEDEVTIYYAENGVSVYVEGGSGSGVYTAGETVLIEAEKREVPFVFHFWSGDNELLADSTLNPTFFQMPVYEVKLAANYRIDSSFYKNLSVVHGTGDGKYLPGDEVEVTLQLEKPLIFEYWKGGADFLAGDSLKENMTFQMPQRDVQLEPEWEVLNVSFSDHLYPIFENHCNDSGCHGANGSPSYLTYEAIASDGSSIVGKTQSGNMPPPTYGQLSDKELEIIRVWVEEGMQDN